MAADVLATQGATASATMILTKLNRVNSVPAREEVKKWLEMSKQHMYLKQKLAHTLVPCRGLSYLGDSMLKSM